MSMTDRRRRTTAFVVAMAVLIATPLAVGAAHRFTDVPDSNVFHNDISWLADADVTRGCNPPANDRFCPTDNVTRQQMAAFMNRLANNKVVHAATAEDADALAGKGGVFYETRAAGSAGSLFDGGTQFVGQNGTASTAEITAPAAGTFFVTSTSSWDLGTYVVVTWVEMDTSPACDDYSDGDAITGTVGAGSGDAGTAAWAATAAGNGAVEVSSGGTHTFYHCVRTFSGTTVNLDHALRVVWHPADTVVVAASSASQAGAGAGAGEGSISGK